MLRSLLRTVLIVGLFLTTACAHVLNVEIGEIGHPVSNPQFSRILGSLLGPPILDGNRVTTLVNGHEIFPSMLQAIRGAKRTICFETFIYWKGAIGKEFSNALAERARNGVAVHVIIDAVGGARIDKRYIEEMERSGVEVVFFHPLHWFRPHKNLELDHRTHRKLLIVDGRIGFTGGVGIGDEWSDDADSPTHWRDTHYRIEGPVVAQLQSTFMATWIENRKVLLHDETYFPALRPRGSMRGQMFASTPKNSEALNMHLFYGLSIAAARRSILIATAYFIPDEGIERLLLDARAKGVSVKIIVPGPIIDYEVARKASKARWGSLLKAGVEIYEYQPTLYHCKQMVVDDMLVSIGSSNFDNRSFRLNDEANLNILNHEFALEQRRIFEADLKKCKRITYEAWRKRPYRERVLEMISSIFAPEL